MLTDEEINDIKNDWRAQGGYVDFLSTQFARAIERAVLAKAGEQEPAKEESRIYDARLAADRVTLLVPVGYKLYASPLPAQAIPEGWRLTDYGQIKAGDVISLVMAGRRICTSAKEVLNAGTKQEEIVYNRKKNHYFITSMVLGGTSNHKDVFIIPADSLSASPKP